MGEDSVELEKRCARCEEFSTTCDHCNKKLIHRRVIFCAEPMEVIKKYREYKDCRHHYCPKCALICVKPKVLDYAQEQNEDHERGWNTIAEWKLEDDW